MSTRCDNCGHKNETKRPKSAGAHGPRPEASELCCSNCGALLTTSPQAGPPPGAEVPSGTRYLIAAVLSTICCCMPIGIVAIIHAAQIDDKVTSGNLVEAERAARSAVTWSAMAIGAWILVMLACLAILAALAMFSGRLPG